MPGERTFCDGIQRRDFLRLGTAGLFGLWALGWLVRPGGRWYLW